MSAFGLLVRDARFWTAALLLVQTVLFYVAPTFPKEIWAAVDAFAAVILAILVGSATTQRVRAYRTAQRAAANRKK